jgi:X-Pro dipeptidyl-peptidase C-terminal non-catalytic domain/X-Pro dipeptidyl-peptidase (S15 family)
MPPTYRHRKETPPCWRVAAAPYGATHRGLIVGLLTAGSLRQCRRPVYCDSAAGRCQSLQRLCRDPPLRAAVLSLLIAGPLPAPILLSRTPYGATSRIAKDVSAHLGALLDSNDVADDAVLNGGYIRVVQDVRGKARALYLRGRYRDSFSNPKPIPADQKQVFRFALPTANHVFLPGHRIMVQVQSSWFPLYDRNPQTYVDNIFFAKASDYKKATIKIFDGASAASFVDLPVVSAAAK